jgi:hypothetical protein
MRDQDAILASDRMTRQDDQTGKARRAGWIKIPLFEQWIPT